jgi:hypothetical protein
MIQQEQPADDRIGRLAAQLRANLRRRKAQARGRREDAPETGAAAPAATRSADEE